MVLNVPGNCEPLTASGPRSEPAQIPWIIIPSPDWGLDLMTQIGEWAEDPEEMERREGPRRMWARGEVNLHKQGAGRREGVRSQGHQRQRGY